jgi:Asp-tRNA(Asn)/Glu-tRNA(Gln) amidotransferase A subunit family amidase
MSKAPSSSGTHLRGLRLAFAETAFWDQANADVVQAVRASGEVLAGLGARVESLTFPEAAEAQALNPRGLVAAEAYTIHQARIEQHLAEYDPIVSPRIMRGDQCQWYARGGAERPP